MARLEVHADRVLIRLTKAEKALAMQRHDVRLDRSLISSAVITDDPWVWLRGVSGPGTHVRGRLAYGTWRHLGGRDFVLARRGREAVVIDLDGAEGEPVKYTGFDEFSRVILSTAHAAELVRALRLDGEDAPVFTTETA